MKSDDKISCKQVCKGFRVGRIILLVFLILLSKPEPDEQHTKTENKTSKVLKQMCVNVFIECDGSPHWLGRNQGSDGLSLVVRMHHRVFY